MTLQARAGECSGPCLHSCAARMRAGALARRRADEPRPPCRAGAWRCKRARPAVQLLRRAKLGQVAVLGLVNTAARPACQPERWRANALVCGAQRHKRSRPAVRLPRRSKLKHVTVLGLVDTAARAACQPERVWGRARSGRRPRSAARWRQAAQARSAGRAAAAPLQTRAGDCSGPC